MAMEKEKQEQCFVEMCRFLKTKSDIFPSDRGGEFNRTELRLLNEVVSAQYQNEHIISTQLAKRIGVTRSSVAQMVADLERRNILRRLPAEDNKKIAYVVLAEGAMEKYGPQFDNTLERFSEVVEKFGEKRFHTMCNLWQEFLQTAQGHVKKKKKTK